MTQEIKRKLTRQKLIDKGYELINTYGYHAISIDTIIKEVNLTKGAFYYHFENKHHFVEAIIEERMGKEIHSNFIEPLSERGNPVFILTDLLQEKLINDKSLKKNLGSPLINFIVDLSYEANDYDLQLKLKDIMNEWKVALINFLYRGIDDGYLSRHINTEPVAEFIISSLEGARTMKRVTNDNSIFYNYIEQFKNYLDTLKATNEATGVHRYQLVS
ncbi:TetR/AcrR family transcriptional regulator [Aureibaculum marinum]|uniref:TetR/AcrR family transcriptional regulator n=1 Tax=Aureibaculum marinum TaxID=2487930 RepID=A0A3N4NY77_9FLAO|nr:TetR/AcrR family transcriptional regulator [Aureibaculum marinum]RPD96529.1 TetR/AcrR family transcriptional regulator [Aureibaculum marinum]